MYQRYLNLQKLLEKKSFFLFGPRSTGKTTLIQRSLPKAKFVDLLHAKTFGDLVRNPSLLEEILSPADRIVVIDEIQKLPSLLDEVQRLIQRKGMIFLLTGSSARKLRHGGANLLAGRAREAHLFPLTFSEINNFDLIRYLNRGGLPQVYDSDEPEEELRAYVGTYLQEEIKAEAVTRNVIAFAEFLDSVAIANGQEINYERYASDLQVSTSTLKNYFQILSDTLIGFQLAGFSKTKKRKAITRAKHYLFDVGVARHLAKVGSVSAKSKAFGDSFEHFIIQEIRAFLSYERIYEPMGYWRSTSQFEVDVTLGDRVAIEIKATSLVNDKHLKGLRALMEEKIFKSYIVVSCDQHIRHTSDGITILPWKEFLIRLWRKDILDADRQLT